MYCYQNKPAYFNKASIKKVVHFLCCIFFIEQMHLLKDTYAYGKFGQGWDNIKVHIYKQMKKGLE